MRASSWASTTTRRARSVNRSNIFTPCKIRGYVTAAVRPQAYALPNYRASLRVPSDSLLAVRRGRTHRAVQPAGVPSRRQESSGRQSRWTRSTSSQINSPCWSTMTISSCQRKITWGVGRLDALPVLQFANDVDTEPEHRGLLGQVGGDLRAASRSAVGAVGTLDLVDLDHAVQRRDRVEASLGVRFTGLAWAGRRARGTARQQQQSRRNEDPGDHRGMSDGAYDLPDLGLIGVRLTSPATRRSR
jgi:hypothetical protein